MESRSSIYGHIGSRSFDIDDLIDDLKSVVIHIYNANSVIGIKLLKIGKNLDESIMAY